MISRRSFSKSLIAAPAILPGLSKAAFATEFTDIRSEPVTHRFDQDQTEASTLWGYNGSTPGPVLRAKAGQQVAFRLKNALPQPTSIHWHGLRLENRYDGVAGWTQDAVKTGDTFDYEFTPPDPGTYWYHSHNRSWEQVARGLAGPLIIEETEPPQVDQDLVLAVDDWLLNPDKDIQEDSFGALGQWSHGGRLGNFPTVNGQFQPTFNVRSGERLRLRLINIANARVMNFELAKHDVTLVAVDGQPVVPRSPVMPIELAPGQRVDLIVDAALDPGDEAELLEGIDGQSFPFAKFKYSELPPVRQHSLDAAFALPLNPHLVSADVNAAEVVDFVMEGGAMGSMSGAYVGNEFQDINSLVSKNLIWAFNQSAGMPDKPLFTSKLGKPWLIRMRNDTAWDHVIHIHGHHAQVVERSQQLVEPEDWRDGFMVRPRETVGVAFIADNPGTWMIHCHMLEHQAGGMMSRFDVV